MTEASGLLRGAMARWLKVPPEPHPPAGSTGSIRIFRAARNYFRLKQCLWLLKQVWLVLAAVVFAVVMHRLMLEGKIRLPPTEGPWSGWVRWFGAGFLLIHLLPLLLEIVSMPFTYALVWLDYDQRWYIATDRSLRIREGVWRVREMTLTYANIQQITMQQGPLQRWLGISDLVVTTAGGGGGGGAGASKGGQHPFEPIHTGILRGVDNAAEIRDLILARMRALKDAGLGDPDDVAALAPPSSEPIASGRSGVMQAVAALREETRALRAARVARGG